MSAANWPRVKLGEVLHRSAARITLKPNTRYREVTVRLWGKGVTVRREVDGMEVVATDRFLCSADQFILSRIDARNGAFGLVPPELDGAIVTNDFPLFDVDASRLDVRFLSWLSKTAGFVELCRAASEGTTNRVRLKEDVFLDTEISLPPPDEQRRIVARVDAIADRIAAARRLREEADAESNAILATAADKEFELLAQAHEVKTLGTFDPHVTSGPRNWAAKYASNGTRFYRAQDLQQNGFLSTSEKVFIDASGTTSGQGARLADGDLMFVITGATVGRVAVYTAQHEPGFVSQHVAICRLPQSQILPAFVHWRFRSREGYSQLIGSRYGQGKPGLNLTNIRDLSLPVPPVPEQRRIVAHLDALQAKADALKALQTESAAELDALLPAVLAKAFAGEL